MDYENVKEKVMTVFYKMPEDKQVHYVAESVKRDGCVFFPMSEFTSFCNNHFHGDFAEVAMMVKNATDRGLYFDKEEKWCLWNKKNHTIESSNTLTNFVFREDDVFDTLANPRDLELSGFSREEIREILEVAREKKIHEGQEYKIILGDETGHNQKVYEPSAVTWYYKVRSDGSLLMKNAFFNSFLSLAISAQLIGTYKRVIWLGKYANGRGELFNEPPVREKEHSPFVLKIKENVSDDVEIPDYEEIWNSQKEFLANSLPLDDYFNQSILPLKWESFYLVNKDKAVYVDLKKYIRRSLYQAGNEFKVINPMVLLTATGNTLVDGDYYGTDMDLVGTWAWNLISFVTKVPDGYREITPIFMEEKKDDLEMNERRI